MKLSASIITKGEHTLEALVDSIRPHVDEVCIAYNGPDDETTRLRVSALADYGRFSSWTACNDPETGEIRRFDRLRNHALAICSHDAVVWADSDDTLDGAEHLRAIVAEHENDGPCRVVMPYWYDYDPNTGLPNLVQWRERIVIDRRAFHWVKPVHEGLVAIQGEAPNHQDNRCIWKHHRKDFRASDERNLRILRDYIGKHGPGDLRILYDYGMALAQVGERFEAARMLKEFVEQSGRRSEKAQACLKLSSLTAEIWDMEKPAEWAREAAILEPQAFAPLYQLARIELLRGKMLKGRDEAKEREHLRFCLGFCDAALETSGDSMMPHSPHDRLLGVYEVMHDAHMALGQTAEATEAVRRGAEQSRDPGLMLRFHVLPAGGADIVISCGDSNEPWNPRSVEKTGIGGSEVAVIAMAKRLAAFGHRVRVFNRCEREGLYDGVEYRNFWEVQSLKAEPDLLIAWRSASFLEPMAREKWLWVHDAEIYRPSPYWISLADRVLALSRWHASHLEEAHGGALDPKRISVTANGVEASLFDNPPQRRDPTRAIYASSWDRGLERLLDFWPLIRMQVQEATLHVFYGDAGLRAHDAKRADRIKEKLAALARAGVVDRGRVDQRTLAREMMAAGVFAYPTKFTETSCQSAMAAQCAGMDVVTSGIAALVETVKHGIKLTSDPDSPEYRKDFVAAVVESMRDGDSWSKTAVGMFSWDMVAQQWNDWIMASTRRPRQPRDEAEALASCQ
jgi:glycosyltransferase involved in cell wall biosynthesis